MTVNDEVVIDDEPETARRQLTLPPVLRSAFERWQKWPLWVQIVSGIAGAYVFAGVATGLYNTLAGGDSPAPAAPITTTVPASPVGSGTVPGADNAVDASSTLDNLPDLNPLAALLVPERDYYKLSNAVGLVSADGTSLCQIWFGTKVRDDGSPTWAVTTLADQQRHGGFVLPSTQYPVRLFAGEPCDRLAPDVPATTTTTTAAPSPVAGA